MTNDTELYATARELRAMGLSHSAIRRGIPSDYGGEHGAARYLVDPSLAARLSEIRGGPRAKKHEGYVSPHDGMGGPRAYYRDRSIERKLLAGKEINWEDYV